MKIPHYKRPADVTGATNGFAVAAMKLDFERTCDDVERKIRTEGPWSVLYKADTRRRGEKQKLRKLTALHRDPRKHVAPRAYQKRDSRNN